MGLKMMMMMKVIMISLILVWDRECLFVSTESKHDDIHMINLLYLLHLTYLLIFVEQGERDLGSIVGTLTWRGEVFSLYGGVTLLGKAPYAGGQYIKLDHKSISDKHATITFEDGMS